MTTLDEQKILDFKQNGYLILRDFIDSKIIDQWRCQFWQQVGGSLEDPTSWSQAKQTGPPKLNPNWAAYQISDQSSSNLGTVILAVAVAGF